MPGWLLPVALVVAIGVVVVLYSSLRPQAPTEPVLPARISTPTGDMMLVPAGKFLFGEKKEPVSLPAFYVDKTEVTNAAYAAFCAAKGRALPKNFPRDKPGYPAVEVSIVDAQAFANWAGKRLPTAREWEKAARGADGRNYPWGNEADLSRANLGSGSPRPADDMANGASPYGALNMVGNVWEFVGDPSGPSEHPEQFRSMVPPPGPNDLWYTIRGGSFRRQGPLVPDLVWDVSRVPARWTKDDIGFRCVKDPPAAAVKN
jgi:serine/threonine-protein kinase